MTTRTANRPDSRHQRPRLSLSVGVAFILCLTLASYNPARADEDLSRNARRSPVVQVFEARRDAVVSIASTQVVRVRSPLSIDRMMDDFFGLSDNRPGAGERELRSTSVGSGFVIHPAGYIVTNAHVVARTTDRKVMFANKKEFDAQVVAINTRLDLALLKVEPDGPLPTLPFGTSSDLMVGETAIAIGNPLGYQHTVTAGVVSALDRSLQVDENTRFEGLIQTDASINPGNSGGPLLNVQGQLIGINTAIRGDAQNIGFAIPVDKLRQSLPELLDIERRYGVALGFTFDPTTTRPTVKQVNSGSTASRAGLKPGDTLTHVNDTPLTTSVDFYLALIGVKPGQSLTLQTTRPSQTPTKLTLTLEARVKPDARRLLMSRLGIEARPMTPDDARKLGIRPIRALIVTRTDPKGPAAQIGLQAGDIIDRVGEYQATSLEDIGERLLDTQPNEPVTLSVIRIEGRTYYRAQVRVPARAREAT